MIPRSGSEPGSGLCPLCRNVRTLRTAQGSVFRLCLLSQAQPRIPKYPPQPVLRCAGFISAQKEPEPVRG